MRDRQQPSRPPPRAQRRRWCRQHPLQHRRRGAVAAPVPGHGARLCAASRHGEGMRATALPTRTPGQAAGRSGALRGRRCKSRGGRHHHGLGREVWRRHPPWPPRSAASVQSPTWNAIPRPHPKGPMSVNRLKCPEPALVYALGVKGPHGSTSGGAAPALQPIASGTDPEPGTRRGRSRRSAHKDDDESGRSFSRRFRARRVPQVNPVRRLPLPVQRHPTHPAHPARYPLGTWRQQRAGAKARQPPDSLTTPNAPAVGFRMMRLAHLIPRVNVPGVKESQGEVHRRVARGGGGHARRRGQVAGHRRRRRHEQGPLVESGFADAHTAAPVAHRHRRRQRTTGRECRAGGWYRACARAGVVCQWDSCSAGVRVTAFSPRRNKRDASGAGVHKR
eukprot:scaffold3356_cov112-Isochrysis_galbana.AAC.6